MDGHRARVGCMAWSSHLLSTGSRDKTILQRDVRAPEHWTSRLAAHRSEVRSFVCPWLVNMSHDVAVRWRGRVQLKSGLLPDLACVCTCIRGNSAAAFFSSWAAARPSKRAGSLAVLLGELRQMPDGKGA